jgi:hypothetical protein
MRYDAEANQLAGGTRIPPAVLAEFLRKNDFTNESIHDFSEAIEVGPGMVVGRSNMKDCP